MEKLLTIICLGLVSTMAFAQDITTAMQQEAQKCAKALLDADYDKVVLYTHKRVIEGMGGKEAMISKLKQGTEQMHSQGISFESVTIGKPEKPKKIGSWMVAFIPQRIIMKVPNGHLERESELLGVSENEGKEWVFIDAGFLAKPNAEQAFPELAGKLEIPEQKQAVFKKDQ